MMLRELAEFEACG